MRFIAFSPTAGIAHSGASVPALLPMLAKSPMRRAVSRLARRATASGGSGLDTDLHMGNRSPWEVSRIVASPFSHGI